MDEDDRYLMSEYYNSFAEEEIEMDEFFCRVDRKLCANLKKCKKYQNLIHSCEKIKEKYPDIANIIEVFEAKQKVYSVEEVTALTSYIRNQNFINDYVMYEMYKIGFKECIELFQMIDIL